MAANCPDSLHASAPMAAATTYAMITAPSADPAAPIPNAASIGAPASRMDDRLTLRRIRMMPAITAWPSMKS